MNKKTTVNTELIQCQNFILATRDSGYKSTASALAEIVDNSIEAKAKAISINVKSFGQGEYEIEVRDDGKGMDQNDLKRAIQFGGSTKFNSRIGLGRYGMGLPNSSLSQARKFEVITWKNVNAIYKNYLDVDEVVDNKLNSVMECVPVAFNPQTITSTSGTIVTWKRCDRLSHKSFKPLLKNLHSELGRIFRHHIWQGVIITINDVVLKPIDPLYLEKGNNLVGGKPYGQTLKYEVKIPGTEKTSQVQVRFIEMPVQDWHSFSNEVKRDSLITKRAGVSILRNNREIDYAWYFMGDKRKENYDDWWRCEISFFPELDELFGVTHTKQGITPNEYLKQILTPDIQAIARLLNARVRQKFLDVKKKDLNFAAQHELEKVDHFLPPPLVRNIKIPHSRGKTGLQYQLQYEHISDDVFFVFKHFKNQIEVVLNKNHAFYDKIYHPLVFTQNNEAKTYRKQLEILIFAAIRAATEELEEKPAIERFMQNWSKMLSTFIE